jgi:N-hydroxyarylamine O-acetyltransferase
MAAAPPTDAQISAYLKRIGFSGKPRVDLETLTAIHRGHVESIPWDNLDVALGRPLTRDPADAFVKLVTRRRGGWCYEMNGLLGWMLEALGFEVTRLAGAVNRVGFGDEVIGNHLLLLVELDRTYIADTGFGTGLIEPVALEEGEVEQDPVRFRLERLDETWWRFHNHDGLMPPSFDFAPTITDETLLEARCQWLQNHPKSHFKGRVVVNSYRKGRLEMLDLPRLWTLGPEGMSEASVETSEEFARRLADLYGAEIMETPDLWEIVAIRPAPV